MGHNVRLLVPTQDENELVSIIGLILERHGGVTVSLATGWWNIRGGTTPVRDKASVIECSVGEWTEQVRQWWHDLAKIVLQRWEQEAVFLSVSGEHAGVKTGPLASDYEPIT